MKNLFRIEKQCVIGELDDPGICRNAKFQLDRPLKIDPTDFLELTDGQWFLISNSIRVPISGRWVTMT